MLVTLNWHFKLTQGQIQWCHWNPHILVSNCNYMSICNRSGLIDSWIFFSYFLSLGPNFGLTNTLPYPPPPRAIFFQIEWFPPKAIGKATTINEVDWVTYCWRYFVNGHIDTTHKKERKVNPPCKDRWTLINYVVIHMCARSELSSTHHLYICRKKSVNLPGSRVARAWRVLFSQQFWWSFNKPFLIVSVSRHSVSLGLFWKINKRPRSLDALLDLLPEEISLAYGYVTEQCNWGNLSLKCHILLKFCR